MGYDLKDCHDFFTRLCYVAVIIKGTLDGSGRAGRNQADEEWKFKNIDDRHTRSSILIR